MYDFFAPLFPSNLSRKMIQRHPYHFESHTTKCVGNLHCAWEVQKVLLNPLPSSVITTTSTEQITLVQTSFLAVGTAGLKGSTTNESDFITSSVVFSVFLKYWSPEHWVTWELKFKFPVCIFLEKKSLSQSYVNPLNSMYLNTAKHKDIITHREWHKNSATAATNTSRWTLSLNTTSKTKKVWGSQQTLSRGWTLKWYDY